MRLIVESPQFKSAVRQLKIKIPRIEEILDGMKGILSSIPEDFVISDLRTFGVAHSRIFPGLPRLRVAYSFDDNEVHLLNVDVAQVEDTPLM